MIGTGGLWGQTDGRAEINERHQLYSTSLLFVTASCRMIAKHKTQYHLNTNLITKSPARRRLPPLCRKSTQNTKNIACLMC